MQRGTEALIVKPYNFVWSGDTHRRGHHMLPDSTAPEYWVRRVTIESMGTKQGTARTHKGFLRVQLYPGEIGVSLFPADADVDAIVARMVAEHRAKLAERITLLEAAGDKYNQLADLRWSLEIANQPPVVRFE